MTDDTRRSGDDRRIQSKNMDNDRRTGQERRDLVGNYDRVVAFLKSIRIFRGLDEECYRAILRIAAREDVKRGHFVYEKGEESDAVYILIKGKLQELYHGRTLITNITPVGFFGEVGVFTGAKRAESISAIEDSTVLKIHKYELFKLLYHPRDFSRKILLNIICELSLKIEEFRETIEKFRDDQGNVIV